MDIGNRTVSRSSISKKILSKTQVFKTKAGKCHRPGPILRNPYLNFLREFRLRNCGLSAVEIIRRGAKEWKTLPKETKLKFIEEAFYAPKKRRPPNRAPMDAGCCPIIKCPSKRKKKRRRKKKRGCGRRRKPKRRGCKRKKKKRGCRPKKKKSKCPKVC